MITSIFAVLECLNMKLVRCLNVNENVQCGVGDKAGDEYENEQRMPRTKYFLLEKTYNTKN